MRVHVVRESVGINSVRVVSKTSEVVRFIVDTSDKRPEIDADCYQNDDEKGLNVNVLLYPDPAYVTEPTPVPTRIEIRDPFDDWNHASVFVTGGRYLYHIVIVRDLPYEEKQKVLEVGHPADWFDIREPAAP